MFKILFSNLDVALKQIERTKIIELRKIKALELNIPKNLNRMKTIDGPAYVELMDRYKKAIEGK